MLGARAKGEVPRGTEGALGLGSSLRILAPATLSERFSRDAKGTSSGGAGIWLERLPDGLMLGALAKGVEPCRTEGVLGL